ncbi:ATP-binding protein [Aquimarina sp. RZ0]|uniref:sensor histidine kinase n=1 Tax=Aquimarina sp. RZ0 TaxID=2607730 RepID=UPI0011F190DA|nr:ATP-binding protein [Aquimarina sp. RZ0]KAA1243261.1 hypothetical protein F0000_21900 [Aquimarina sp. RZ0]
MIDTQNPSIHLSFLRHTVIILVLFVDTSGSGIWAQNCLDKEEKVFQYASITSTITTLQNWQEQQTVENIGKERLFQKKNGASNTRNEIILLVLLILLLLGVIFLIYREYTYKKRVQEELKKKEEKIYQQSLILKAQNKELEQFRYITSHDLQEPLNTISSFIDLLSEDYGSSFDETGKESLSFIRDASRRMKKLFNALLEYSRLGKTKERSTVNITNVLATLQNDFENILERTNTKIIVGALPIVKGVEVELRLLLQHLISNAIKFTKDGVIPEVTITAIRRNSRGNGLPEFYEFSVKDNGIGIPEMHKERIFLIFQRLHSTDTYQGIGMGLSYCKKIVESHGGNIWLESKENEGTTFYFTIPM